MRMRAALVGVTAAAVALGVAELVAVATGSRSAPLVAVGGVVVDTVPESLKHLAISLFGLYDKIALLTGTVVVLLLFAAAVGVLALRNRWYGFAGIAVFAAAGIIAALTRTGATALFALPTLIGAVAAAAVLDRLLPGERLMRRGAAGSGTAIDRRWVLVALGGAVVAGVGGRLLSTRRSVDAARAAVDLPAPSGSAAPIPAGSELGVPGLSPYLTSNRDFYRIDTALAIPQVDPDTWELRIHGQVRKPLVLSFRQLLDRPMVERHITLCCVSNEVGGDLIGNARWLGVPVKDLLDEAGPLDGADQVIARSVDGFTTGTPTEVLRDGRDALLAVGMNGEPLPIDHGFPVRMVTPGLYGYVSACKWIVDMELTSFADVDAYWIRRGWAALGPIKTQSRIDVPRRRQEVRPGRFVVAGVAWAQHVGISRVEVSVDGGDWHQATVAETASVDTWRQWSWPWDATSGRHTLRVRATNADGQTQPEERRPIFPDGATGWHTVTVDVR